MDMDKVKEVRARTQASLSACKRVVTQAGGDVEAAIVALQKSGEAKAAAMAGRIAAEGKVYTYRHPGDRIAVVVEVNCETDFSARSPESAYPRAVGTAHSARSTCPPSATPSPAS